MDKDLGREPMPLGEKNIAYRDSAGYRARGVVILDSDGEQAGVSDSPLVADIRNTPETAIDVTQIELHTTFIDILKELKKINFQLSIMTDNSITNDEVEGM